MNYPPIGIKGKHEHDDYRYDTVCPRCGNPCDQRDLIEYRNRCGECYDRDMPVVLSAVRHKAEMAYEERLKANWLARQG